MTIHFLFTAITNLFGLNFCEPVLSLDFVVPFILTINVLLGYLIYLEIFVVSKLKLIFLMVELVQLGIPFMLRFYFNIRAIAMVERDRKLMKFNNENYKINIVRKNQRNFLIFLAIAISLQLLKLSIQPQLHNFIYAFCHNTSFLNATNDFLFVYQIMCLRDHTRSLLQKKVVDFREVLKILKIQKLIHKRYSLDLTFSISIYFLLTILALFWIFIRISFGYFQDAKGKRNFLNSEKDQSST